MKRTRKWIAVVAAIMAVALLIPCVLALGIWGLWGNEIATLRSLTMVRDRLEVNGEGAVYTLHVKGGFYLEEFVEQGGVQDDQALVDFIVAHFTKGLIDLEITTPTAACSSFAAQSARGDYLFGRNYDSDMTNVCVVFTEASEGRHATISSVDLKYMGIDPSKNIDTTKEILRCIAAPYAPLDGMNDAGVACAIYLSNQGTTETPIPTDQNTDLPDMTPTTLIRLILDYADDLDEAVEIAKAYDMHDSAGKTSHYMVADASGRSAVLEWVGDTVDGDTDGTKRQLVVTYNDADDRVGEREAANSAQVVTNFILRPGYYKDGHGAGYDRYERMWQELEKTDCIVQDELAAMDILKTVGIRRWDGGWEGTAYSIVFNMTQRKMLWIPNENFGFSDALYTFDFSDQ